MSHRRFHVIGAVLVPCLAALLQAAVPTSSPATTAPAATAPAFAVPDWLPTTASAATQPAWLLRAKQLNLKHGFHHWTASMSDGRGEFANAEQFLEEMNQLCLQWRGREAVQGPLPDYLKSGPPAPLAPGFDFTPFNLNRFSRTMTLQRHEKVLRESLGQDDIEYLAFEFWMAVAYRQCGDYGDAETAERYANYACKGMEAILEGNPHPFYADCLVELADDELALHKYDEAERLLERALRMLDQTIGLENASAARIHLELGTIYLQSARYPQATEQYQKAKGLLAAAAARGQRDLELLHILVLEHLAALAQAQADDARAVAYLREVLAKIEALNRAGRLGQANRFDFRRAQCQFELGAFLAMAQEPTAAQLDEAEHLLNEAKEVCERELGSDHPATAEVWFRLAQLYLMHDERHPDDREKGIRFRDAAMKVFERAKDRTEPDRVSRQNVLMYMSLFEGKYGDALAHAQEALGVARQIFGQSHPSVAQMLLPLAVVQEQLGRLDESQASLSQALSMIRRHLDFSFMAQSEDEQLRMTQIYRSFVDAWLSARLRHRQLDDRETWEQVLSWKGTVFVQQRAIRQLMQGGPPRVRELFRELQEGSRELQALVYAREAGAAPDANRDQRIATLRQRAQEAEVELSRELDALVPSRGRSRQGRGEQDETAQVQAVMPSGVALIDFLQYRDERPPEEGKKPELRYVAFVVTADRVVTVPLGPAAPIHDALEKWRDGERFLLAHGLELRRLIWAKIQPHLGNDVRLVLISPDGPLATLPFAALPGDDAGASYLIERVALATIPVPQLLPSLLSPMTATTTAPPAAAKVAAGRGRSSALLVGAVDFDSSAAGQAPIVSTRAAVASAAAATVKDDVVVPRGASDGPWIALPGTAQEIEHVWQVFRRAAPDVTAEPLEGAAADKAAFVKALSDKQYVHVATHAFFAAAGIRSVIAPVSMQPGAVGGGGAGAATVSISPTAASAATGSYEPGLLSGLVFAGANRPQQFDAAGRPLTDDGILTALEVSQLDLSNLRLVVLSACETALGKAAGCEGLLGLQRAFQLSGSRTVVASMWKVDDRKTSELMTEFYQHLLARHEPPVLALRKAQLAILMGNGPEANRGGGGSASRSRGVVHETAPATSTPSVSTGTRLPPALWAAWVVSGDPGDLSAALTELEGRGSPAESGPPVVTAMAPQGPAAGPAQHRLAPTIGLGLLIVLGMLALIWHRTRAKA
jgi:CHAT domain-containing protein